jgi:hypothetical protein
MANGQWQVSGEYFEACSCDFVCPCPTSGLAAQPTKGHCDAGLVFHVDHGQHGSTKLDGLNFAILLRTPGPMIAGNWTVGVILDDRASPAQREALTAIARARAAVRSAHSALWSDGSAASRRGRSRSRPPGCAGRSRSRVCSTSPSRESRGPIRASPSTSTTSVTRLRPGSRWRRPRAATCTPSASTGTRRRAGTTATSRRSPGAPARLVGFSHRRSRDLSSGAASTTAWSLTPGCLGEDVVH